MNQGPKLPKKAPAPRQRGSTPRFQHPAASEDSGIVALRGVVRLLARQAARELFDESDAGESR